MSIFATADPLPKGPHSLSREEVAVSQRTRLMAAFTELLAERGFGGVTIGELAGRAGVSRGAFYEHFSDKEDCLLAAYDHFASTLIARMTADLEEDTAWEAFIERALRGYLGLLEDDPVAARAFLVEMDGAGPAARARRREAMHAFAALITSRQARMRAEDPSLGELPEQAWLGFVLGVRELVHEALEEEPRPALAALEPAILSWLRAMIAGAGR